MGTSGGSSLPARAWSSYRACLRPLVALYLPAAAVLIAVQVALALALDEVPRASAGTVSALVLSRLVLPALVGSFLVAAAHALAADHLAGLGCGTASLRSLRGRVRALVQGGVLAVCLALGLSLVPVLGLAVLLVWGFPAWGPPLLVGPIAVEGCDLAEAWALTRARMRGRWPRALGALLAGWGVIFALLAAAVPVQGLLGPGGTAAAGLGAAWLALVSALAYPLYALLGFELYCEAAGPDTVAGRRRELRRDAGPPP